MQAIFTGGFFVAIMPQQQLFSWHEIEGLGDLERLVLVLEHMPDEQLMQLLERLRGLRAGMITPSEGCGTPCWHGFFTSIALPKACLVN